MHQKLALSECESFSSRLTEEGQDLACHAQFLKMLSSERIGNEKTEDEDEDGDEGRRVRK